MLACSIGGLLSGQDQIKAEERVSQAVVIRVKFFHILFIFPEISIKYQPCTTLTGEIPKYFPINNYRSNAYLLLKTEHFQAAIAINSLNMFAAAVNCKVI